MKKDKWSRPWLGLRSDLTRVILVSFINGWTFRAHAFGFGRWGIALVWRVLAEPQDDAWARWALEERLREEETKGDG